MTTQLPAPAPSSGTPSSPSQISTPRGFADWLLSGLGIADITANEEQTVIDWEAAEGGHWHNTAYFNPLNTTLRVPGSHVLSGGGAAAAAGVQAYSSWQQGLDATLSTILEPRYRQIVTDLRSNAPETQTAADIGASPWGTPNFKPGIGGAGNATGNPPAGGGSATGQPAGFTATNASWWNPLDWPGYIGGALSSTASDAASGIGAGIVSAIETVTKPLFSFIENGFLVVFGVIIIIVGLVLLAHAAIDGAENSGSSSPAPSRPPAPAAAAAASE